MNFIMAIHNYNRQMEILANFPLIANFVKIKLYLT